jgi:hypothetical protein
MPGVCHACKVGWLVRKARLRAEIARLQAELDAVRPYLGLAHEIHDHVQHVSEQAHGAVGADALAAAVNAVPQRERAEAARAVFAQLSPEAQWTVLERVFGDTELRDLLEADRVRGVARADRRQLAASIASGHSVDLCRVPEDEVLTLGLFREADVAAGADRGPASSSCARRLVLRAVDGSGTFQVLEDVYNPNGGLFVTPEYDEAAWRKADRLPAHALVRLGSITDAGGKRSFEPMLFRRGRVDVESEGQLKEGRLHLGFALLGDISLFTETSSERNLP